jgi:hypothetical protein
MLRALLIVALIALAKGEDTWELVGKGKSCVQDHRNHVYTMGSGQNGWPNTSFEKCKSYCEAGRTPSIGAHVCHNMIWDSRNGGTCHLAKEECEPTAAAKEVELWKCTTCGTSEGGDDDWVLICDECTYWGDDDVYGAKPWKYNPKYTGVWKKMKIEWVKGAVATSKSCDAPQYPWNMCAGKNTPTIEVVNGGGTPIISQGSSVNNIPVFAGREKCYNTDKEYGSIICPVILFHKNCSEDCMSEILKRFFCT